jgi:hypothetical protein
MSAPRSSSRIQETGCSAVLERIGLCAAARKLTPGHVDRHGKVSLGMPSEPKGARCAVRSQGFFGGLGSAID